MKVTTVLTVSIRQYPACIPWVYT